MSDITIYRHPHDGTFSGVGAERRYFCAATDNLRQGINASGGRIAAK